MVPGEPSYGEQSSNPPVVCGRSGTRCRDDVFTQNTTGCAVDPLLCRGPVRANSEQIRSGKADGGRGGESDVPVVPDHPKSGEVAGNAEQGVETGEGDSDEG